MKRTQKLTWLIWPGLKELDPPELKEPDFKKALISTSLS